MPFETEQIYALVNEINAQANGANAVAVVDTSTLVALGNSVLSSTDNTEAFINTFVQRIGKTIVRDRAYESALAGLVVDDFQWGAIVQKIAVGMPVASESEEYTVENGESCDMYTVSLPTATQKLFVKRTPYSIYVTVFEHKLKEAFLSVEAMGAFISAIYTEVRNKLVVTVENLGHLALCNFIAISKPAQVRNLVTEYNALTTSTLTASSAMFDAPFLRYAIGEMNQVSKLLKSMSVLYNGDGQTRFTPMDNQRFACLIQFVSRMETVVEYGAFHRDVVSKAVNIEMPYWQGAKSPMKINLKIEGITAPVVIDNVVGLIFDQMALGTYKREEAVLTTPVNAKGRYTNTYWHESQLWFNDISENGVVFTLN